MTNLNVAIFGCSGAIGKALCIEYINKPNIDNVQSSKTKSSRQDKIESKKISKK